MVPIAIMVICAIVRIRLNSILGECIVIVIDAYACANSVITLYFVKPYRVFIVKKFYKVASIVTCGRVQPKTVINVQYILNSVSTQLHTRASVA